MIQWVRYFRQFACTVSARKKFSFKDAVAEHMAGSDINGYPVAWSKLNYPFGLAKYVNDGQASPSV